ncbi:keratin, type I cytoskeletal 18-like isoform X1 [Anguilla anguilla]|uniref:keratin, type I cytoskeletal 18-like isoform X1 n=1 Tax=Anguilla anguilla TaxID=7936 RepID=UPI0015B07F96|nr:keratin, type I cytoskeletal 18-like isoform X1 [Anguilla anguilla]
MSVRYSNAPRSFSSMSASGTPALMGGRYSSNSMFGGAGGRGSRISMSTFQGVSSAPRPYAQQNSAVLVNGADDKGKMQDLNCRLDKYLSQVRMLEESNKKLEDQIKEELLKRGSQGTRDWSVYDEPLADLRGRIRDTTMDNAQLLLQIDNARLAADDFKVKFESELALRQGVEQDIAGLRKIIDDTNMCRLQLESQIEATQEELAFLRKNHEEDLANLRSQITNSNVSVELNAPKGQDMNETISKIRDQYEKTTQKSQEDTNAWFQDKFDKLTAEVSLNTEALQDGKTELTTLRREKQALEVDLQALHNMNHTLEDTLMDTQNRYGQKMTELNQQLRQLEAQLADLRAQAERQAGEYQALLNLKSKLEEEIADYHRLLGDDGQGDRVEFSLDQALQAAPPPQTRKRVIIVNQEIVDGKVVSRHQMEADAPNGSAEDEDEEEGTRSPPEQEVTSD